MVQLSVNPRVGGSTPSSHDFFSRSKFTPEPVVLSGGITVQNEFLIIKISYANKIKLIDGERKM